MDTDTPTDAVASFDLPALMAACVLHDRSDEATEVKGSFIALVSIVLDGPISEAIRSYYVGSLESKLRAWYDAHGSEHSILEVCRPPASWLPEHQPARLVQPTVDPDLCKCGHLASEHDDNGACVVQVDGTVGFDPAAAYADACECFEHSGDPAADHQVCVCGHTKGAHVDEPSSGHGCLVRHCGCVWFLAP